MPIGTRAIFTMIAALKLRIHPKMEAEIMMPARASIPKADQAYNKAKCVAHKITPKRLRLRSRRSDLKHKLRVAMMSAA